MFPFSCQVLDISVPWVMPEASSSLDVSSGKLVQSYPHVSSHSTFKRSSRAAVLRQQRSTQKCNALKFLLLCILHSVSEKSLFDWNHQSVSCRQLPPFDLLLSASFTKFPSTLRTQFHIIVFNILRERVANRHSGLSRIFFTSKKSYKSVNLSLPLIAKGQILTP